MLITSAYHMPRAIGAFRQAGFDVEAWPVDYRTRGEADLARPFDKVSEGLRRVDVASREWVGLLAYWLDGTERRAVSRRRGRRRRRRLRSRPGCYAVRQSANIPVSTQPLR